MGIIADITDGPPESPASPAAYIPFDQVDRFGLVIRATQDEFPMRSWESPESPRLLGSDRSEEIPTIPFEIEKVDRGLVVANDQRNQLKA